MGDADPARQQHVLAVRDRDRPRLLDRRRQAAGDERVAGPALLHDRVLPTVGRHEDRRVERRVLAPAGVAVVEHPPPDHLRAEPVEVLLPHLRVHRVLAARHALLRSPASQREHPAQDLLEQRHAVLVRYVGPRDPVQRHRHRQHYLGHLRAPPQKGDASVRPLTRQSEPPGGSLHHRRRFIRWPPRPAHVTLGSMLSPAEIDAFVADGYVAVRGALPAGVLRACQDEIWSELSGRGVRREDPATWRDPVVRINCPDTEAFAAAGTQPVLWEAFDQLIGAGRWWRRRGVGGTIPMRFPSPDDPGDAGWHIEGSFSKNGDWWVNYRSRQRGLLALYLFSDVDEDSAPTRVRPGSHRDAARVLAPAGDEGMPFPRAAAIAAEASAG